jgi:hypothetical protein
MMMRRGRPGLIGVAAKTEVVTGTAGRVSRRQQNRYAAQDQQASEPQAAPPAAAPAEPEYMAELEQLAKLRDQGILSPEEFEAKKKQILGV